MLGQPIDDVEAEGLHIAIISVQGLLRGKDLEGSMDGDAGSQARYVLELTRALAHSAEVRRIDLITRQVVDNRLDSDYAQLEESLDEKAAIYRIPFGPKRYLRKERLWPYMDFFVDQVLASYRRGGVRPDLIHGHGANGGFAGAQLARLLAVPYVFTGHELARVQRQHLLRKGHNENKLENRYSFATQIEAEEFALETASLVIAHTHQEVEERYKLYHNHIPERMEVIAPGVDLTAYDMAPDPILEDLARNQIKRFLSSPERPLILAINRPSEHQNLEMLVNVYGRSKTLQQQANLVLIMGSRDDLRQMSILQQRILRNLFVLFDVYDLHGMVAYPKQFPTEQLPVLFRFAASSGGVFINPALVEPLGFTLMEAAAAGLPVVASQNGTHQDVLANCRNGLLVDPYDAQAIEKGLLRVLTETDSWQSWSENGMAAVHQHYSWQHHVDRYLRDIEELVAPVSEPSPVGDMKLPLKPGIDRLLVTNIDETLLGEQAALQTLMQLLHSHEEIGLVIATGHNYADTCELVSQYAITKPVLMITSVGTEIYTEQGETLDQHWHHQIDFDWEPERIREILGELPGLNLQSDKEQTPYKISYQMDTSIAPSLTGVKRRLRQAGLRARAIFSLGAFLDIIPERAGADLCLRYIAHACGLSLDRILVAGDSGSDEGMLCGNTLGVVVANHSKEIAHLRGRPRIYFAESGHAQGIIEGIHFYHFLDNIAIPNDWVD